MAGCLGECPVRFEASHYNEPGIVAPQERLFSAVQNRKGANRHGEIEALSHFDAGEACRRHSDYLERDVVYQHPAADGGVLAAEVALPETIAEHNSGCGAPGLVILPAEETASGGRDLQRRED